MGEAYCLSLLRSRVPTQLLEGTHGQSSGAHAERHL
jgi:hypothetical protein